MYILQFILFFFFLILYFESSGSLLYSGIVLEGLEFYSFYISFICEMNFYSRALLHTHTKLTTIFVTIELASQYWFLSNSINSITFLTITNNLLHQQVSNFLCLINFLFIGRKRNIECTTPQSPHVKPKSRRKIVRKSKMKQ